MANSFTQLNTFNTKETGKKGCFSSNHSEQFIMAALRSRCGHYILQLWLFSSSFFLFFLTYSQWSETDLCHTSTHDVALVQT